MWSLRLATVVLLLTACSSEDELKWSRPASAERRQGDWIPLSPPCLNCPLEQVHDASALSSVLTPPQRNNAVPRTLSQQDTSHSLAYQSQDRPFQQQPPQPSKKFLPPQLIQSQPFLQTPNLHSQGQFLAQSIPSPLLDQQFISQNEQFLPPNVLQPSYLTHQNQFLQLNMNDYFGTQLPHQLPFYSEINPTNINQVVNTNSKSIPVAVAPNMALQAGLGISESLTNQPNKTLASKNIVKEREEVQILYVPVETLKQRSRSQTRVNLEETQKNGPPEQQTKEARPQTHPKPKFRHPIQPLKDLIPASQLKEFDSQTLTPLQKYINPAVADSKPLHSINNQDYVTPSVIREYKSQIPTQDKKEPLVKNSYSKETDLHLQGPPSQSSHITNDRHIQRNEGSRNNLRAPHQHGTTSLHTHNHHSSPRYQTALEKSTTSFSDEVELSTLPPPNQPPLSVYMETNRNSKIGDVLTLLKGSKTIPVLDSIGPDSPQVFVGPSNLNLPEGYVKFELPYLSSLDGSRIERKVESLPFFVAPLNFEPPPGYSKILFPAPHIGSVVVSNQTATQNFQHTPFEQFLEPQYPSVTFRDPYTIPVDISPISPQLPSLINSLQEDKYSLTPAVDPLPLTTTTETSTSQQTRNYNSRRQNFRGSQRGYLTSSQSTPTRKFSRTRRPLTGRTYTPRNSLHTEPGTTTPTTTPYYPEEYETTSHTNVRDASNSPVYSTDAIKESLRNRPDDHPSNLNNFNVQFKNQYESNYEHDGIIYNHDIQSPISPTGENSFIPDKSHLVTPTQRTAFLENTKLTTIPILKQYSIPNIDTTKNSAPDNQAVTSLHQEPNIQRYVEDQQNRGFVSYTPESHNQPSLQKTQQPVYTHAHESEKIPLFQPQIEQEIPSIKYSQGKATVPAGLEYENTYDITEKQVSTEKQNLRAQYIKEEYFQQQNYGDSPRLDSINPGSEQIPQRPSQSEIPERSVYSNKNEEIIRPISPHEQGKLRVEDPYENQTPASFEETTTHPLLRVKGTTEPQNFQTNSKHSFKEEPSYNERHTNPRTRFRSRGRYNSNKKSSYEQAVSQVETENTSVPDYHTTQSSSDKLTTKPPLVRVRGRVRGRTRSQLKQTTTEAPNYPQSTSFKVNEYSRTSEDHRPNPNHASGNEFESYDRNPVSATTQVNVGEDNYSTSTTPVTTSDRFPSRKQNFRNHRRPRPSTSTTSAPSTQAPRDKYLIRTRKPHAPQTRVQTGRGRIRRPTKPTTTEVPVTTPPNVNVNYELPETYDQRNERVSFQNAKLSPLYTSEEPELHFQQDKTFSSNYDSELGQRTRLYDQNEEYERDLPRRKIKNRPLQNHHGDSSRKEPEHYWNQPVTIQQSQSYVFSPETTVKPRFSTASPIVKETPFDYDDYFNYQESSQFSTSDQSPFPSNEQRITFEDVKPSLNSGKESQYPKKDEPDSGLEINQDSNNTALKNEEKTSRENERDESKFNDEQTAPEEHSKPEREEAFSKGKITFENTTKKNGRRRGTWVRVKVKKPKDVFVTAESQSFGALSSNSIHPKIKKQGFIDSSWINHKNENYNLTKISEHISPEVQMEEISTEITEAPTEVPTENYETTTSKLTTDNINPSLDITTNNPELEDYQTASTTEESPIPATPAIETFNSRVLGTSTTTEISLETEICYRGRCIKTKKINRGDSSDLMPME